VTGQETIYHAGDNGAGQYGSPKAYTVLSTGQYAGTTNVDTPHYAAATLSFTALTKTIADSANGLATVLTGDTIRILGSGANDGIFTVATGGSAGSVVVNETLANESAGAVIIIFKRTTPSNNCIQDSGINRMWRRYVTKGEKVGAASNGKLVWYDSTKCFILHAADANLSMDSATKILKIAGGAGAVALFNVPGILLELSGFTVAANNWSGGYPVVNATVNGSDLDILLNTGPVVDQTMNGITTNGNKVISGLANTSGLRRGMVITGTGVGTNSVIATIDSATQVTGTVNSTASGTVAVTFRALATQAAGGSRAVKIVCQSMFGYIAACNAAALAGYTDWRAPYDIELGNIRKMNEAQGNAAPDSAAFPSWPTDDYIWSATTNPNSTSYAMIVIFNTGYVLSNLKTTAYYVAPLRG
jgi:hypothetical protein